MPFFFRTFIFMALAVSAAPAFDRVPPDGNEAPATASSQNLDTAIFAGGSFWYMEAVFEALPGVDSATAGTIAGDSSNVEAVQVLFHPRKTTYAKLLEAFWKNIDPTRADGQFSDDGAQYRTIVFHRNGFQRKIAEASRKKLSRSKRFSKPIITEIAPATVFRPAEAKHQDFYKRNAPRYKAYVEFSGREAFFKKAWGGKGDGAAAK